MAQIRVRRTYSFTCLPEALIRDLSISDRAVRLWALLDRYAKGDDYVSLNREVLAADLGCSLDSIDRALAELVRAGWLTHNGARGGKPREYQLWINEEVRKGAENLVRKGADKSPQGCGQVSAPVRTTHASDLGKPGTESREKESPLAPRADAPGEPCSRHRHLGRPAANCRPCGTAGRPSCDPASPGRLAERCRSGDGRNCDAAWCECPHHLRSRS